MRRTFGLIVLFAALASGQASLAQQDPQQLQQQQDRQQRDVEEGRQRSDGPPRVDYRAMASEARRHAERAKAPASKAQWLKTADNWDQLARADQPRPDR
jgi:hypothetical protein